MATEAGIEVVAPVHDAFLIMAPVDRIEHDVTRMRGFMSEASAIVLNGFRLRCGQAHHFAAVGLHWPVHQSARIAAGSKVRGPTKRCVYLIGQHGAADGVVDPAPEDWKDGAVRCQ